MKGPQRQAPEGHLFDPSSYTAPEPEMDYEPSAWLGRRDISFHSSERSEMPLRESAGHFGVGIHHGDFVAAGERGAMYGTGQSREGSTVRINPSQFLGAHFRSHIHPIRMTGETAISAEPKERITAEKEAVAGRAVFTDVEANTQLGKDIVVSGANVPYANEAENKGSISFRSPRKNLRTWSEDVLGDPGAPQHLKNLAKQFDVTVPVRENMQRQLSSGVFKTGGGPEAASGPVYEQPSLFPGGESKMWGYSNLKTIVPRLEPKSELTKEYHRQRYEEGLPD